MSVGVGAGAGAGAGAGEPIPGLYKPTPTVLLTALLYLGWVGLATPDISADTVGFCLLDDCLSTLNGL
jgi:hypothetical protein